MDLFKMKVNQLMYFNFEKKVAIINKDATKLQAFIYTWQGN